VVNVERREEVTKSQELSYYTIFHVNGKTFTDYDQAKTYRQSITEGPISFEGLHMHKGWVGFYYRLTNDQIRPVLL
jgi:hypothetical protein